MLSKYAMRLAFLAFEAPSKDVVLFASDIAHGLYRLGYDAPFRPQDQLHFGDDLDGTVDTAQPQQDLVDAAPFFRCSTAQAACSLSDVQLKSFTAILPRDDLVLGRSACAERSYPSAPLRKNLHDAA
ncbi:hypothetical protein [Acidisphaera sp. S103]|uniref:hypothetical protein n=1 Tax=Acidisphaera sp. S103 TaxID=1747223 RepID=UPI00131DAE03|nr:hypothetical protein [Acidisphaera sp. S103]